MEKIVERYINMVYRLALVRTRNASDAEDVTQDVFERFLRADKTFDSDEHIKAWLIRVTINRSNTLLRSPHRKNISLSEETAFDVPEKSDVSLAVQSLPLKYRTAIYLHYYEGMSVKEISKCIGAGESAVKSRLFRGRKMLKAALSLIIICVSLTALPFIQSTHDDEAVVTWQPAENTPVPVSESGVEIEKPETAPAKNAVPAENGADTYDDTNIIDTPSYEERSDTEMTDAVSEETSAETETAADKGNYKYKIFEDDSEVEEAADDTAGSDTEVADEYDSGTDTSRASGATGASGGGSSSAAAYPQIAAPSGYYIVETSQDRFVFENGAGGVITVEISRTAGATDTDAEETYAENDGVITTSVSVNGFRISIYATGAAGATDADAVREIIGSLKNQAAP